MARLLIPGRVLDRDGTPAGMCCEVAPAIVVTASGVLGNRDASPGTPVVVLAPNGKRIKARAGDVRGRWRGDRAMERHGARPDQGAVLAVSGAIGMLHFACHNTFRAAEGGSVIAMGTERFVPDLLNRAVVTRSLAARGPLVFINACRSAGFAPEYTRLMGWAGQFMAAGAGAFVGTLWPVRSSSALTFAEAFYGELLGGKALGGAALAARQAIASDAADPTWLAYTVYGDPMASVTGASHAGS